MNLAAIIPTAEASSIGVIGGADGPTAIFVTANASPWLYVGAAALLIGLCAAGAALYIHHKKQ